LSLLHPPCASANVTTNDAISEGIFIGARASHVDDASDTLTPMVLTSVPLTPRVRWWTKLARFPRRIWSISQEATAILTDHFHRPPSKRKVALIRIGTVIIFILLSPVALVLRSRIRGARAFAALHARVRQIWPTSAIEAVALLRATFEELIARGAFVKMKRIEIAPFGKFESWEMLSVQQFLYKCEVTLGHLDEALAVAAALPGRTAVAILQQVDCLVALGRRADAIALLERNLDIDGWRGPLHRRLTELGGSHLRALN
jgi:hypothetical protein